MARNGSGVYTLPAGSDFVNGDTANASSVTNALDDLATDANTARPVVAGGTGATTAAAARTNLGLVPGTDVQAQNAALQAIADGQGVPTGGDAKQVLRKIDGDNYNTEFVDPANLFDEPTTFPKALRGATQVNDTATGSITLDFNAYQNFKLTLTGNVTLANPTTEQVGQSGFIVFIQDATGSRTVSLGTDYETAGGAGLTLSTAASATDVVPYIVAASGRILLGAPQLAFS